MDTIVIGAGLAGLALASELQDRGTDVVVLEAADRPGGVIRSERIDGVWIEHAAATLRGVAPGAWEAVKRLGLADRVVEAAGDHKLRFVLQDGRLVPLPGGPLGLLGTPLLGLGGRLRILAEPLVRRGHVTGESVYDLLARRIGPQAADRLGTPFVGGIFGGDPREVDAEAVFPQLVRWEAERGSLVRGAMAAPRAPADAPRAPVTFEAGIESLPRALADRLGDRVRLGHRVTAVTRDGAGWRVTTDRGTCEAAHVAVAVPPHAASAFLPDLGELRSGGYAPVAAVHLAWRAGDVPAPAGFGWLCHPSETRDALGVIHVSTIFPGRSPDRVLVRVMLGGTRSPGLPAASDEALVEHARAVVSTFQGLRAEPVLAHVARALPGIPQYERGFPARLATLRATGLRWLGWGYTGMGLPDQLAAGKAVATAITGS